MVQPRLIGMNIALVVLVSSLSVLAFPAPQAVDVSLEEFSRMDHISQGNYLYSALNEPGFAQSSDMMSKAAHFLNKLDWNRLSVKDEMFVDKFVQEIPMDIPASRTVANRYFGKLSGKKLSITTGKDLSWNGHQLASPRGAVLDPRKIPMDVLRVEEVNGNFVFRYRSDQSDEEPARVTLRKGEFELGGMHDELTQPSRFSQFSVEGGDVEIGGVIFHPDTGRIDALEDDNFKIQASNLRDDDPASLIMLGKNRELKSDVEVVSRQSVTFVGGRRALFNQYSNGVLIQGLDIHAKGSFDLTLSEFDKDESFAEYVFKDGVLDKEARKVNPDETDSGISIHYVRKGERVVWDVDGDDFEEAPTGFPITPASGKPRAGEVREEGVQTPKRAQPAPSRKSMVKESGEKMGERIVDGKGEKGDKEGKINPSMESPTLKKRDVMLPTGILPAQSLGMETKDAIAQAPIFNTQEVDVPRKVTKFFIPFEVTPGRIRDKFLETAESNSKKIQKERPDLRQLDIEFRRNYLSQAADFFSKNTEIGRKNIIITKIVGNSVVIQIQDKPYYFVYPKKFREVADLLKRKN